MNKQKKVAVINDFSGFGRCSLMVSVPIISAMKLQCCALPTAIFSNHTGYEDYFFDDYTDRMKPYYRQWEKLGLSFDGIYTGFLGSVRQVELVEDFIRRFARPDTAIVVDPVMGDNGRRYATIDDALCEELRKLLPLSTVITPNLTEACLLAERPFRQTGADMDELAAIAGRLHQLGAENIVITGIIDGNDVCDYVCRSSGETVLLRQPQTGTPHAGTGDVFASIIAADAVRGEELARSVQKAASFVGRAIRLSDEMGIPEQDGICFEELLGELSAAESGSCTEGFSCGRP